MFRIFDGALQHPQPPTPQSASLTAPLAQGSLGAHRNRRGTDAAAQPCRGGYHPPAMPIAACSKFRMSFRGRKAPVESFRLRCTDCVPAKTKTRVTLSLSKGLADCGSVAFCSSAGYKRDHTAIGKIPRRCAALNDILFSAGSQSVLRNRQDPSTRFASLRMTGLIRHVP